MMAATLMTESTPMATPSTVSVERSLWARTICAAVRTLSSQEARITRSAAPPPGRSHRAADADLFDALGHRHQHDVGDDDAAHHRGHRGDEHENEEEDGADVLPELEVGFGGGEEEIVGRGVAQPALPPHQGVDFLQRRRQGA